MSPTLSRENYFLTVINQLNTHHVKKGSLEQELQGLLLELADSVRLKRGLNAAMLERMNGLFERYQAVRLKVSLVAASRWAAGDDGRRDEGGQEWQQPLVLHTEFADGPNELKRMYMEAVISLLEAMEKKPLELATCIQCGGWYIPYQRAQVTKFCGTRCRNRFNYVLRNRKQEEAT